jgi:hypothetical protein
MEKNFIKGEYEAIETVLSVVLILQFVDKDGKCNLAGFCCNFYLREQLTRKTKRNGGGTNSSIAISSSRSSA